MLVLLSIYQAIIILLIPYLYMYLSIRQFNNIDFSSEFSTLHKFVYIAWLDSKIFSQPEFRNLSTPIKQPIACIQIQTGSLVLILVYIFNYLILILIQKDIYNIIIKDSSKAYNYSIMSIISDFVINNIFVIFVKNLTKNFICQIWHS